MKRRNFLSGLMAAPVAVKARLARFFVPARCVEHCGAAIFPAPMLPSPYQRIRNQSLRTRQGVVLRLLCAGKIDEEVAHRRLLKLNEAMSRNAASEPIRGQPSRFRCSRPRGHKGPHALLNPR